MSIPIRKLDIPWLLAHNSRGFLRELWVDIALTRRADEFINFRITVCGRDGVGVPMAVLIEAPDQRGGAAANC